MSKNAVKLGLMPPLTGLVGIYGTEISRAGQIACQEVNENGGVLGRPLELVIEDDGSLPESAVVAATRLVDEHRCAAIIGNLLSNSRIAVAYRVAEPRKIPYLNFSFYEGSIISRYFFHFAALPNQQIDRMIPYMRNKYGPRMFFAGNNYEWPRGSVDAAKRALLRAGGAVVGEEYCPIGVSPAEIESLLDHVEQAAPDVFVPYFAGVDQVNLLTRFTERGLKSRMAVVMGHYDEMMASILPAEVREGFYSSNTYFMTVDSEENRNYLAQLSKLPDVTGIWPKGNGILTNFGEGTYLCVKAFAQAANEAGSVDSEALIAALNSIQLSGPQGTVTMYPDAQHAAVNTYLSRCENDGSFTLIENFGVIEPQIPERYNHQRIANQATLEDDIRLQARILEQMTDAILLVSTANGSIVYTNSRADRMFAYDKNELIGKPISVLNNPSDKHPEQTAAEIIAILNEKGEWQGEVQNIKKDGTSIWCSATISTFTHPMYGEVWLSVERDVTERKAIEEVLLQQEALKQSEKRSRSIIDASPVPLAINDSQGNITFLNNAFIQTLGYTNQDIPTLAEWWPRAYPDPQYRLWVAETWQKNMEDSNHMGIPFSPMELNIVCKNKSVRTFIVSPTMLDDGMTGDHLVSLYDITERKQSELKLIAAHNETELAAANFIESTRRLNTAQHIARLGDYTFDLQNNKMTWSDTMFELLGFTPASVMPSNELFMSCIEPEDIPVVEALMLEAVQKTYPLNAERRVALPSLKYRVRHPDGSVHWLVSEGIADIDDSGKVIKIAGPVQDVTLRMQYEFQLTSAKETAERANAAKSEFLSRMSHELRTPLNAILGFGQLLEMDPAHPLSELQTDNLKEILYAGNHLLELINEILDLSRIESGRLDIVLENISVAPLVNACISQLQPQAMQANIHINIDISPDYMVQGDLLRLREVISNLLSNAIKYNRKGGDVFISCRPTEDQHINISVRDTGRGIDAAAMPRLFKPFERMESAYDGIDGTGIGLALAKKLVEAMNGKIGVESKQGSGSTFWFELPMGIASEVASKDIDSHHANASSKRYKLLYIEDNPANMRLMHRIITAHKDIELLEAENAEDGLKIALNQQPELILLDIELPGMDGYEVLQQLRVNPLTRDIPVIALSANAMTKDLARGKVAGFKDYLTKPVDVARLRNVIDTLLNNQ